MSFKNLKGGDLMKRFSYIFIFSLFLLSNSLFAAKKSRSWSISANNGYTFKALKDATIDSSQGTDSQPSLLSHLNTDSIDGFLDNDKFFSSLDISRNFKKYEVGMRIQFFKTSFVSPFLKINFIENKKMNSLIPFFKLGLVPDKLLGIYSQLGVSYFLHKKYLALTTYVGIYHWRKVLKSVIHDKNNTHFHFGMSYDLYF